MDHEHFFLVRNDSIILKIVIKARVLVKTSALSLSADPSMFRFPSALTPNFRQMKTHKYRPVFEPPTETSLGRSLAAQFQKIKDSFKNIYLKEEHVTVMKINCPVKTVQSEKHAL